MSRVWLLMLLTSMIVFGFKGDIKAMEDVLMNVGQQCLEVVLPLICNVAFFNGILYIAKDAGLLHVLAKLMHPLFKVLFKDVKHNEDALAYISSNVVINMLGLGSAATPSGLMAMKELQKENNYRSKASRSMVTFLIMNTAGVTLFPTSVLALRYQYGASDVAGFLPYAMLTTIITCIIALLIDRLVNYRE